MCELVLGRSGWWRWRHWLLVELLIPELAAQLVQSCQIGGAQPDELHEYHPARAIDGVI
jgi:hypothetical protein